MHNTFRGLNQNEREIVKWIRFYLIEKNKIQKVIILGACAHIVKLIQIAHIFSREILFLKRLRAGPIHLLSLVIFFFSFACKISSPSLKKEIRSAEIEHSTTFGWCRRKGVEESMNEWMKGGKILFSKIILGQLFFNPQKWEEKLPYFIFSFSSFYKVSLFSPLGLAKVRCTS